MKIDKNQAATIVVGTVIAAVIIFFLQKYLTKKFTKATGEVASYVGHDAIGHF